LRKTAHSEVERDIAESVGLGEHTSKYPQELTMGDLRRLELARVLSAERKIVLLDEIFAGLTVAEIAQLAELIRRKREEGLTSIVISHDLRALARLVDRVVVICFGELMAEGSYQEIINNEKVKQAYLGY
jgi:ABC-type branched-subunit amino acid transport system ATPase component